MANSKKGGNSRDNLPEPYISETIIPHGELLPNNDDALAIVEKNSLNLSRES